MKKHVCLFILIVFVCAIAGLARGETARAGWCWPDCSNYATLGPGTSTYNGCWYSGGEVCSGWNYWVVNGVAKRCVPFCDGLYTHALILYGFENGSTIRGRYTDYAGSYRIFPYEVSMGGYMRAQVNWWPYRDGRYPYSSTVNAAAGA